MIKKKEEPVEFIDLTGLTDDEIRYLAECFVKELKKVLDGYKPYLGKYDFFQRLCSIHSTVKARLEEESRVE